MHYRNWQTHNDITFFDRDNIGHHVANLIYDFNRKYGFKHCYKFDNHYDAHIWGIYKDLELRSYGKFVMNYQGFGVYFHSPAVYKTAEFKTPAGPIAHYLNYPPLNNAMNKLTMGIMELRDLVVEELNDNKLTTFLRDYDFFYDNFKDNSEDSIGIMTI